nr:MAG: hypothetical protein [Bacteriophage sp.]
MPRRVSVSTLNASTLDILNVIRQNASYDYQQNVPAVEKANDIPKVGEVLMGQPALANQFINALVNRIAIVRVQSATFNNPYSMLKKGYIEFGETVEDIFVSIAKGVDFNPEKAREREYKRTFPDVRSAFHAMNWRVMYPVTIQDEDLKQAFLSMDGVQNLIAKIVDAVYTGAEYDEFLLFKYLLIKAISHGKMKPVNIGDGTDLKESAVHFRGVSNLLPFMSGEYNEVGVKTTTPKDRQVIFMDAMFNAQFDVNVLASAFNMDKADFMGRLFLIDNWTSFDNERFDIIRANSDGIEEVTSKELALLANVKAVILDENWFQVYDNNNKFTEKYSASGLYWNYFYHTWKTISNSPFSNAVVFVTSTAEIAAPESVVVKISSKDTANGVTVFALEVQEDNETLQNGFYEFVQTSDATTKGIAIQKYGAVTFPAGQKSTTLQMIYGGVTYTTTAELSANTTVGATLTFNKS